MKLKSLSYSDPIWQLENIDFEDACLVVGKNATGKSKTLTLIDLLVNILTQNEGLSNNTDWTFTFGEMDGMDIIYRFKTSSSSLDDKDVVLEEIKLNNEVVFFREASDGSASIFNFLEQKFEVIFPPTTKLIIHTNRDLKKFPFLESIALWAEQSYGFRFGSLTPNNSFETQGYKLLANLDDIPDLYSHIFESAEQNITSDLTSIGFKIDKIDIFSSHNKKIKFLYAWERDVFTPLFFRDLSQGLFRCISLLIFLEYLIAKKKPATVIIDDLCEGLDYERATKLGKLVFEKCLANNIQLIATSNDAFLMETVDLKYWNVLQRNGSVVTSLNAKNHPDLFRDFKFTGLSNFDFFASDYIAQKLEA